MKRVEEITKMSTPYGLFGLVNDELVLIEECAICGRLTAKFQTDMDKSTGEIYVVCQNCLDEEIKAAVHYIKMGLNRHYVHLEDING